MVYREGSCPGFPIVGGMWGAPPILHFFSKTPTPSKPLLKNEAPPSKKHPPPPIETWSTHEMIPRKSTINNNLKSS